MWWRAPGRGIALAVLTLAVLPQLADVAMLQAVRDRGFDAMQLVWPLPAGSTVVQVIAIDEDSLKREGQWPWPRAVLANLVRRIAAGKPAALGVDILFPEADGYSPPRLARTLPDLPQPLAEGLASLPSSDDQLGQALADVPAILGAAPVDGAGRGTAAPHSVTLVRQIGSDPRPYLRSFTSIVRTLPEISRTARGEGALTSQPDNDGVVRAIPLLTLVNSELIPTFGLGVISVAAGIPSIAVKTGAFGIESVELGPLTMPTDAHGRAYLHFGEPRARYISAATVLGSDFDVRQFNGQIVLLGVTGLGLIDRKFTPVGLQEGIALHAELIEAILGSSLLRRPAFAFWIELGITLAAGLAVIGLVRADSPRLAAAAALGITAGLVVGEFALFRFAGWLIDGVYPAVVTLLVSGGMLVGHLRAAYATRRRLAGELDRQRELTARSDGELATARHLQLGLLPHRFPAFPDRRDIDLFARIEPARAVGGDFFDFRLIDPTHLFFIIADVSGKGVPAALFMEMTLQIVRAAVQRYACNLDRVMSEANARTAEASMELGEADEGMFVTAFAGILDTDTGDIVFASAGHDSPFLVRDPAGLRQLNTDGGPPLGVLDDYPYPVDRDRLAPGATLLLFTDGLTEAQDAAGELYSLGRVTEALQAASPTPAQAVVDACFDAVGRFVGDAEQADDITLLAIRLAPAA
ncbi:MAG TPA: CHASE2 domain-containing protein [Stellaceae bacterium]|nr:CHASE2 domain-containing protein [Stellaceae bacterium]